MSEGKKIKHHIRYLRILAVLLIAAAVIAAVIADSKSSTNTDGSSSSAADSSDSTSDISNKPSKPDSSSQSNDQSSKPDDQNGQDKLDDLRQAISAKFNDYPGDWSAYVKNLKTGEYTVVNDRQIYPASIIKLFALGACYQKIEEGAIKEDDYYSYLYSMTVMSNNAAFNQIIWTIGTDYLTQWCSENGYTRTKQYHGLRPAENAEGLTTEDKPNETCASDVGHMLEDIYNGKCVSKEASEKMLKLLSQQHWTSKIPYGLPGGTRFANKTGDTMDYSHDGAIVYSDGGDYVLVIMCEDEGEAANQGHRFIEISSMVYKYFNPDQGNTAAQ